MLEAHDLRSLPGICDLAWSPAAGREGDPTAPALLLEIPHGATTLGDYEATVAGLRSDLPPDLMAFFLVNTDIGAPECAEAVAARVSGSGVAGVLVARCRVPRTFIDCNRVVAGTPGVVVDGLTPAVAAYVDHPDDRRELEARHRAYHGLVDRAYALICGRGGLGIQLHSYAPASIEIATIGRDIVDRLRWAYSTEVYPRWARRPDVDVICEATDGADLSPRDLVAELVAAYRALGLEVGESATYRLHPATMGYHYARRYPQRVLCVELSRGLVADPWVPLAESTLSMTAIEPLAEPLAEVVITGLRAGARAAADDSRG